MKAVTVSLEVANEKQVTNSVDGASSLIRKPAKQTTRSFPSFAVSGETGEAFTKLVDWKWRRLQERSTKRNRL